MSLGHHRQLRVLMVNFGGLCEVNMLPTCLNSKLLIFSMFLLIYCADMLTDMNESQESTSWFTDVGCKCDVQVPLLMLVLGMILLLS